MLTTQPDRSEKISCEFVDDAPTRMQFDQGTLRHLATPVNRNAGFTQPRRRGSQEYTASNKT
jgi:hypothetical protein